MEQAIDLKLIEVGTDSLTTAPITLSISGRAHRLAVRWPPNGDERIFEEADFWESLRSFRRVVEAEGYRVLCQGSRPNVFPSAMARQAGGRKAYAVTLGEQSGLEDLVGTFDPMDDITLIGTIEDQDAFKQRHFEIFRTRYLSKTKSPDSIT
jgi:hypothetical protein